MNDQPTPPSSEPERPDVAAVQEPQTQPAPASASAPELEQPTALSAGEAPVGEIPLPSAPPEPQAPAAAAPAPPAAPRKPQPSPEEIAARQAANEERRKKAQATWERLVNAKSSGEMVQAVVKTAVKGGLLVDVEGYRGFLPASQTGVAKGTPLDSIVGTSVALKVIDVDDTRKRLVVSHRLAQQEERRAARSDLLQSLKVGEERDATVVRLADFGAFVDLGSGIDALIPASELAFERVEKPGDVVKIGERLKVRVLRIDQGGKKIAVSRKGALADPWRDHSAVLQRGKTVEGRVVGKERGLEVEIAPGIIGSVSDREANPEEYEIGETVEVTIRSADYRTRRVRLSTMHSAQTFSSTSFAPLGAELKIPIDEQTPQ
ncbi:MAG: S1 RNA-binding domain-containing protein [Candidatus Baltobacteraceae bacterium]